MNYQPILTFPFAQSPILIKTSAIGSVLICCGVWLVMVEIEEVPVRILYGELP